MEDECPALWNHPCPASQVWSKSWSSAADAGHDLGTEVDNLWGSFSQDLQEMHRAVQRLLSFPGRSTSYWRDATVLWAALC